MKEKAKTDFLHVCWMIQVHLVVMGSCNTAFVNHSGKLCTNLLDTAICECHVNMIGVISCASYELMFWWLQNSNRNTDFILFFLFSKNQLIFLPFNYRVFMSACEKAISI